MGRGARYDATRVQLPSSLNGLFPFLMKGRNESIAYFPFTVQVDTLLDYIEASKGTDHEITFYEACLLALVKVLRGRPALNRYIIGRRLYQRSDIILSFVARRQFEDDSTESNVMLTVEPHDDVRSLLGKLASEITIAKSDELKPDDAMMNAFMKLPRSLLRLVVRLLQYWDFYIDTPKFLRGMDPMRCSVFVANVGSVGMDAPYHHLFEWGTCSIFMTIGKVHKAVVVGDDDQPVVRQVVDLKFALDERIADAYYDARSLDMFVAYFSEPTLLQTI